MNYSAALIEPQAILELAAIVLTIVYVGKLALEDLWQSANKSSTSKSGPSKSGQGQRAALHKNIGAIGLSAGLGYWSCVRREAKRLDKKNSNQKNNLSLWDNLSQVASAGSLISTPKKSLLNQIAI